MDSPPIWPTGQVSDGANSGYSDGFPGYNLDFGGNFDPTATNLPDEDDQPILHTYDNSRPTDYVSSPHPAGHGIQRLLGIGGSPSPPRNCISFDQTPPFLTQPPPILSTTTTASTLQLNAPTTTSPEPAAETTPESRGASLGPALQPYTGIYSLVSNELSEHGSPKRYKHLKPSKDGTEVIKYETASAREKRKKEERKHEKLMKEAADQEKARKAADLDSRIAELKAEHEVLTGKKDVPSPKTPSKPAKVTNKPVEVASAGNDASKKKRTVGAKRKKSDDETESDADDDGFANSTRWSKSDKLAALTYLCDPETYEFQRSNQRIAYDKCSRIALKGRRSPQACKSLFMRMKQVFMYIWWVENHTGGCDGDTADDPLERACIEVEYSDEICDVFCEDGFYDLFALCCKNHPDVQKLADIDSTREFAGDSSPNSDAEHSDTSNKAREKKRVRKHNRVQESDSSIEMQKLEILQVQTTIAKEGTHSGKQMADSFAVLAQSYTQSQRDKADNRTRELDLRKEKEMSERDLRKEELAIAVEREARELRELKVKERQQALQMINSGVEYLVEMGRKMLESTF